MNPSDDKLDRLLRSASQAGEEYRAAAPFGFDTRVVALWRAGARSPNGNGIGILVRRVAIAALAVTVLSAAATVFELKQAEESVNAPLADEFAIADSAIQNEFLSQ
jgi:hypothetical protein